MLGSNILDVAIGLSFVYILFAILCSTVNEWIAGILHLRARTLRKGIAHLLDDPKLQGAAKHFFEQPLVKGLAQPGRPGLPSYIPANVFALALIDLMSPTDSGGDRLHPSYHRNGNGTNAYPQDTCVSKAMVILLDEAGVEPHRIQESSDALRQVQQVRNRLLGYTQQIDGSSIETLQPLAESLDNLREVEAALQQSERSAKASLFKAQQHLELYFDQSMDRVSGWYKRRVQAIIFILAITLTSLLNADTLVIADYLAAGPEMSEPVTTAARDFQSSWADQPFSNTQVQAVVDPVAYLDQLALPIGWEAFPNTRQDWAIKILGLLMTAIATSLGAPFWFDILSKLVNPRMSGARPVAPPPTIRDEPGGILASKFTVLPDMSARRSAYSATQKDTLRDLAIRARQYVDSLGHSATDAVSRSDIAKSWMVLETRNQGISATPEEITRAIDRAMI